MSFSDSSETAVLNQIFKATALPWNGNTNLWLALYTTDPGEAGTAITNEIAYTSYARVAMTRSTDFTVSGAQVSNAILSQFPQCSGGTATATHAAIVTSSSGAGSIIVSGALSASVPISTGIQPQFAINALTFTLD